MRAFDTVEHRPNSKLLLPNSTLTSANIKRIGHREIKLREFLCLFKLVFTSWFAFFFLEYEQLNSHWIFPLIIQIINNLYLYTSRGTVCYVI